MSSFSNYNSKILQTRKNILYTKYLQSKRSNTSINNTETNKQNRNISYANTNDTSKLITEISENKQAEMNDTSLSLIEDKQIKNDINQPLTENNTENDTEDKKIREYFLNYRNNYYNKNTLCNTNNLFITDNISINISSKSSIPVIPEFPNILNNNNYFNNQELDDNLVIYLFIVCYNESFILPHLLKHYHYVTKIFIYDNCSSDNSVDIALKDSRCEIIYYSSKFCDETNQYIKNNCWKQYRGDCHYCIVCDADEFLYHSNDVFNILLSAKKNNQFYSYLGITGINMVSSDTEFSQNEFLYKQINTGYIDKNYSKNIIFCPFLIKEINYSAGSHTFRPESYSNKFIIGPKCILLHFKYIGGIERLKSRQLDYSRRLSKKNILNNQGLHYQDINSIENSYIKAINRSVKIL